MANLLVVYYSAYGHTFEMAEAAADAVKNDDNYNVRLRKIPEFEQARQAMSEQEAYVQAQEAQSEVEEAAHDDLLWADGIVWGIPTRFGNMPAQIKQFIDTAGGLWAEGKLEGKAAGIMTSTNTPHGGQETTIITSMIPLLHLGMIFVGSTYGENPEMMSDKFIGGSPYGPSTIAGSDGSKTPAAEDLNMAATLAERVGRVARGLKQVEEV